MWDGNVSIVNQDAWVNWFDERGMPGPREELDHERYIEEKSKKDLARWMEAMPEPVKPLRDGVFDAWGQIIDEKIIEMDHSLVNTFPDKNTRILILLKWYGSGSGRWSGYPAYEMATERLLLGYSTKDILKAVNSSELNTKQTEGTARLFGGWHFSVQRPDDLQIIPAGLKAQLLNHVETTSDDTDKLGRARKAFGN